MNSAKLQNNKIQKSLVSLYTTSELSDKEIKKTFTLPLKLYQKNKHCGINLTKEVKDLYR